jgi:tetraacyldisaccharide 4'-kinase
VTEFWWRTDEPPWAEALYFPLTLASWAYRGAFALRRSGRLRANAPVISVGNLVIGGAGKTPVAIDLARRLVARGRRPAVLSRGYRRSGKGDLAVTETMPYERCGDEPLLIKHRVPRALVLVGARRARLAGEAARLGADALVLDDGLQHVALARNLDIVVVDASNPLGNGRVLPRGPLRESPEALRRVGARGLLWLTRCDLPRDPRTDELVRRARAAGLAGPVESSFSSRDDLRGRRVFLFAGIARPAAFEALVARLGATVLGTRWFSDHHAFSLADLEELRRAAPDADALLTTEKDLVRIDPERRKGPPRIESLAVDLSISSGEQDIEAALDRALLHG